MYVSLTNDIVDNHGDHLVTSHHLHHCDIISIPHLRHDMTCFIQHVTIQSMWLLLYEWIGIDCVEWISMDKKVSMDYRYP